MKFLINLLIVLLCLNVSLYSYTTTLDQFYDNNQGENIIYGTAVREHAQLQLKYQEELSKYNYGSDEYKNKLQSIKTSLIVEGSVRKIDDILDGNGLWIEYGDGSEGILSGLAGDSKMSISTNKIIDSNTQVLTRSDVHKIGNKKVLSIAAQYWDWHDNDDIPIITETLIQAGFDVTYKKYESQLAGDINDFKNWAEYGLILISTHGFASNTRSAIDINYGLPTNIPQWLDEDINQKRLVIWQNNGKTTLLASNKFFEYYSGKLPNSLIYMSACSVAKNSAMGDTFLGDNALSWIGYSDVVKVDFTIEHGTKLFNRLLTPGNSLNNSFEFGVKENDENPAEMVLLNSGDVAIVDSTGVTVDLEQSVVDSVRTQTLTTDGHFIHYDSGKFDWIYVDAATFNVYKLEGMNVDGSIIWTPFNKDITNSVSMDPGTGEIVFGEISSSYIFESKFSFKRFKPNGHFIHYSEGKFDWLYIDSNAVFAVKLEGLNENGNFKWLNIDINKFDEFKIYNHGNTIKF